MPTPEAVAGMVVVGTEEVGMVAAGAEEVGAAADGAGVSAVWASVLVLVWVSAIRTTRPIMLRSQAQIAAGCAYAVGVTADGSFAAFGAAGKQA